MLLNYWKFNFGRIKYTFIRKGINIIESVERQKVHLTAYLQKIENFLLLLDFWRAQIFR